MSTHLLKSGSRLHQLKRMINPGYDRIWDCCCDHGLLGMSLLQNQYAREVIFVDVVDSITEHLTNKLTQNFPRHQYNWQVLCDDVNNLAVPADDSQLFIIAGVGPDQTINFINSLCASAKHTPIDLLTCSVSGNYAVRKALIHQGYKLNNEQHIVDNNRFYEAIYVSKSGNKTLQDVGMIQYIEIIFAAWWPTMKKRLRAIQSNSNPLSNAIKLLQTSSNSSTK